MSRRSSMYSVMSGRPRQSQNFPEQFHGRIGDQSTQISLNCSVDSQYWKNYQDRVRAQEMQSSSIKDLNDRVTRIETTIEARFSAVDDRISKVETNLGARISHLEKKFDGLEKKVESHDTRLERIETCLEMILIKLGTIEKKLNFILPEPSRSEENIESELSIQIQGNRGSRNLIDRFIQSQKRQQRVLKYPQQFTKEKKSLNFFESLHNCSKSFQKNIEAIIDACILNGLTMDLICQVIDLYLFSSWRSQFKAGVYNIVVFIMLVLKKYGKMVDPMNNSHFKMINCFDERRVNEIQSRIGYLTKYYQQMTSLPFKDFKTTFKSHVNTTLDISKTYLLQIYFLDKNQPQKGLFLKLRFLGDTKNNALACIFKKRLESLE